MNIMSSQWWVGMKTSNDVESTVQHGILLKRTCVANKTYANHSEKHIQHIHTHRLWFGLGRPFSWNGIPKMHGSVICHDVFELGLPFWGIFHVWTFFCLYSVYFNIYILNVYHFGAAFRMKTFLPGSNGWPSYSDWLMLPCANIVRDHKGSLLFGNRT
jgi:hypothetical protein